MTIEAARSKFVPPRVEARPGTLRVTLRNLDPIAHDVIVAAANTSTGKVDGENSRSVTFSLSTPGSYQFLCSYHQGAGMQGVLNLR